MKKKILLIAILGLSVCSLTFAQVAYNAPDGGWTYVYEGNELLAIEGPPEQMLDGTFENNGDWDLTAPQDPLGIVGGCALIQETGLDYLRIQDAGRPSDHGLEDKNRKQSFTHVMSQEGITPADLILDAGLTLAFRLKVPLDDGSGPLDQLYMPDLKWAVSGTPDVLPYPAEGDGYGMGEGAGMVSVNQGLGAGMIGFSLMTTFDNVLVADQGEGLYLNSLYGPALEARPEKFRNSWELVDPQGVANNVVLCNPREWNEFWVQIVKDGTSTGTHVVKIWKNGDVASPEEFIVTGSTKSHKDDPYLWLGFINSDDEGAMDLDYVAYKSGLVDPVAAGGGTGTFDMSFAGTQLRSYPNPSNGHTTFAFNLERAGYTTLEVYNLIGQPVARVLSKDMPAGEHSIQLNVDLLPGQYIYRLQSGDQNEVSRMTILE
jgi:hypothetical protein